MTISQIEERTGLERSAIRFYEERGLISPARRDNSYRDYSEEDAETLLRVKLLRRLGMSVEDIIRLRDGGADFAAAMEELARRLETQSDELARYSELCRTIKSECADWNGLDAARYLDAPRGVAPLPSPPEDRVRPYPVRRYLARWLDLQICAMLWLAVILLVFHVNYTFRSGILRWADSAAALGTMLLLEPLCLRLFGTTPGKRLMGIYVKNTWGRRPSYFEGLSRTFDVILYGMGWGVPVVSVWRLVKSYKSVKEGEDLAWEWELTEYREKTGPVFGALYGAVIAVVTAVMVIMIPLGAMPPHTGDVTAAQFAQNYNFLARYNRAYDAAVKWRTVPWEQYKGVTMNDDGSWNAPEIVEGYYGIDAGFEATGTRMGSVPGDFTFITDGRTVTGVKYVRRSGDTWTDSADLAELALAGGSLIGKGESLFDSPVARVYDTASSLLTGTGSQRFSFTLEGWKFDYSLEVDGYLVVGGALAAGDLASGGPGRVVTVEFTIIRQ